MSYELSIIIPHLNQPDFLRRCLASLAAQSVDINRSEVIVVDNGSRQLPNDVCQEFGFVRLIREDKAGPGPARNRGIQVSQAANLAFIDADCIADENWVAAIMQAMKTDQGCGIFGGDVRIAYENKESLSALEAYESVFAYRQKEYIEKKHFSGTGNLAIRRAVFDVVGPFAGIGTAEDRDWGQRATQAGQSIRYVPEMIVYHPARRTFSELCTKWDRHVAHDYQQMALRPMGKLRWILLSIAVAGSGLIDQTKIVRSSRLSGLRPRLKAATVLIAIRFYRFLAMAKTLGWKDPTGSASQWNRH